MKASTSARPSDSEINAAPVAGLSRSSVLLMRFRCQRMRIGELDVAPAPAQLESRTVAGPIFDLASSRHS
jgi:hypothetical protein